MEQTNDTLDKMKQSRKETIDLLLDVYNDYLYLYRCYKDERYLERAHNITRSLRQHFSHLKEEPS